jgi:site-specific DNA-methyltransferase (adenine-specific)
MNIYNEDCLEVLKTIQDETIDLVVTDCPYHIVSGGCSTGAYGNGNGIFQKSPGGILNRKTIGKTNKGNHILEGTKHIALCGVLNDNDSTTYARQGKLFKHNDIKFSEWLPDLYRVMKPNTHIYIYKC